MEKRTKKHNEIGCQKHQTEMEKKYKNYNKRMKIKKETTMSTAIMTKTILQNKKFVFFLMQLFLSLALNILLYRKKVFVFIIVGPFLAQFDSYF